MRVLFVSRVLPIPNGSGAERRASQHLATLKRLRAGTLVAGERWGMPTQILQSELTARGLERLIIRNIRDEPTRYEHLRNRWLESKNRLSRIWNHLWMTHICDLRPLSRDVERRRREIGGGFDL